MVMQPNRLAYLHRQTVLAENNNRRKGVILAAYI
jgi:hypothetical protein